MSALARLQDLLSTPPVLVGVLLLLVVGLLIVALLRAVGMRHGAALLAGSALMVALAVTFGLTLRPTVAPHDAARVLIMDPREGIRALAHRHIVWGPVIDNIALFVPIGGLASAVFWRRSVVSVWLAAIVLSVAIETVQYVAPIGRLANTADVMANAVGAALGVVVAVLVGARRRPRDRRDHRLPVTVA